MGHCIGYFDVSSKLSPRTIINRYLFDKYDPQETDSYHGNIIFHDDVVYKNVEEAEKAIKNYDRGWYDDHAVLFKDGRKKRWLVKYEYHC